MPLVILIGMLIVLYIMTKRIDKHRKNIDLSDFKTTKNPHVMEKNDFKSKKSKRVNIIGITGLSKSGKDVFANEIKEVLMHHGYKSENIMHCNLAYPIKEWSKEWLFDKVQVESQSFKNTIDRMWKVSPRYWLQVFGETVKSELGRNALAKMLNERMSVHTPTESDFVICTDIRDDEEADYMSVIASQAFRVPVSHLNIKIIRPDLNTSGNHYKHRSEQGVSNEYVDLIILNDESLSELTAAAQFVARKYIIKASE